jgi:hypothetical protein
MKSFIKVVNPGQIKIGGGLCEVFVKIEYDDDGCLSFSGVVGPWHNGNCVGSSGQIFDELHKIARYTNGWCKADVETLYGMWCKYHLNDMRPGCEHQDIWPTDKMLTLKNKQVEPAGHVYPNEHPEGLLGKPCPKCGYKYGSSWLKREVPEDVLVYLSGLPESKKEPAWV